MDINETNASIVPYSKLRNEFAADIPWVRTLKLSHVLTRKLPTGGQNLVLDIGKAFGQLFGPNFALLVACMPIATLPNESSDVYRSWTYDDHGPKLQAASGLLDLHLPDGWSGHTKVVYDMGSVKDPAVHRAMSLLRLVIATKNQTPGPGFSFAQLKGDSDALSLMSMAKEVDSINFGMAKSDLEETADASSEFQPGTSVAMYSEVSHAESEKSVVELPAGPMDAKSKMILLEAQARTPRYLFRAITPWGCLGNTSNKSLPGKDIFHLTRAQLSDMVTKHLSGRLGFKTEFSSWAASLRVAFEYARSYGDKDAYISIIDTKELEGRNVIVHAPSMRPFTGSSSFPEEYLAHGVISGPAHKAVPLQAFLNANASTDFLGYEPLHESQINSAITSEELEAAHTVAAQYGQKFGAAVMIAVLTLKSRDAKCWREGLNGADELVNSNMLDFVVPKRLYADSTVLADIVDVEGFTDVEEMLRMLKSYRGSSAWQRSEEEEGGI
ncbi:hypothetical protein Slin15195_G040080 [Septoria linicola]|uniref:DUF7587 domain-containing protein n=1 Tax=Septoria linicola TaxID=215465 RepID=A0A9Q9AJW4_9PEZI|nr:hypothetical protein Slin15195_G040080 [Septoria linicola]